MFSLRYSIVTLLTCFAMSVCGCGKSETATVSDESGDTDFLADLLGDIDLTEGRPAETPAAASSSSTDFPTPPPFVGNPPTNSQVELASFVEPAQRLELRLKPGDRFPLVKTVTQNLTQKSQQYPAVAQTQLELQMVLEVQQMRPDASLLRVVYSRVGYQHNINGQQLAFDSATHQGPVPAGAAPYFGMVNNGFSFWLGKDNTIKELVGYDQFLQRCVQHVPAQNQSAVLAEVTARFGSDGVANFVDDVIGLLPYDHSVDSSAATKVAVGDVWTRKRRLMQSVPVDIQSTCRLESLTDKTATINITGTIAAATDGNATGPVRINSGRTMGSCVVDRSTGLPIELTRSSFMALEVTTANGQTVHQDKRIETSIRTLSSTPRPVVSAPSQQFQQQPTSAGMQPNTGPVATASYQRSAYGQSGIQQTSGVQQQQSAQPQYSMPQPPMPQQPQMPRLAQPNPVQPAGTPQPGRIDTSQLQSTATAVYPD